jgi:uncharacterized protein YgiM (DUF1202 family)
MLLTRAVIIKLISLLIVIHVFLQVYGCAASPFDSNQLAPSAKIYLVLRDVNVREKPMNKSAVVGRLKKNKRIDSVGKVKGTRWIAVKRDGKNIGFVYGKALVPIIEKFAGYF